MLHSQELVLRTTISSDFDRILFEDLKETLHHLVFFSDELLEDTTNLLSLQISLASQKTNEVMRVLTLFSVFFMPLTFIVGVYGMNFHNLPELDWKYGYYLVWFLMFGISVGIWFWFRKKGWVR
jgi:magnesium transporter